MSDIPATGPVPGIRAKDNKHPERLSDLLNRLADEADEYITLREIAEALDERSFGAFLLVFAIPNLIPLPPGATLVLGLPLVVVAWQIVAGRSKIWLPRRLGNYAVHKTRLQKIVDRSQPGLKWMEALVRPRNWPLSSPLAERIFGFYILLLAIVVVIPIPFGNWLPAFAVAAIGLAHTENDGNCLALGSIIGLIAVTIFSLILFLTAALFTSVI